ncbi:MAG TPA: hypothetical protein VLN57_14350 [Xanthobacteraceae bacterium]|jgi:hypothetical protein|nr:hypothetical protein [Xanthobacteraceae bacterium]
MPDNPNEKRPGAKELSPQAAEAQAVREKMARLRALRLAQEAANPPVAKQAPIARSSAPRQKGKKKTARGVSLSDWLSDQEQSGRRK